MELGFFTMPLHPPGADYTQGLENDLEQLIFLDELGFREAWIGEHFTSVWENIPAPDLLIASAIRQTQNIILGTGVNCMPNHNPFVIASRIAQLDHMCRGRFHWGVGSGGFPGDFEVFGFDPKTGEQRGMTRDAIELVLQLWRDPRPGLYEHKYWRFRVPEADSEIGQRFHLAPYQKPHPPIGVAGVTQKSGTLVTAGQRGWIPMSINIVPPRVLHSHWEAVAEGAAKVGKVAARSQWRIARHVFVADTTREARALALAGTMARDYRDYFLRLLPKVKMLDLMKSDPDMPDAEVTLEYLLDHIWIVGSPDEVTAKLQQLYEEVGGFGVLLAMGHEWEPKQAWLHSMKLLRQEVLPRLG